MSEEHLDRMSRNYTYWLIFIICTLGIGYFVYNYVVVWDLNKYLIENGKKRMPTQWLYLLGIIPPAFLVVAIIFTFIRHSRVYNDVVPIDKKKKERPGCYSTIATTIPFLILIFNGLILIFNSDPSYGIIGFMVILTILAAIIFIRIDKRSHLTFYL